ncbi:hypothetical protein BCPG3_139 [Bacillus phage BCPG3]|uniref:Uncharacterized protein n=1 Tax=Bacillus phage BPS10C TaxID=1277886 RepID=W5QUC3_9CAUD|nr:hypothetical protein BPS10C_153 [Bacillus phage BPS10C]AGI12150.1 hypothetical protein BPS10C_153 [Bacillus phage BPS10C]QSJ04456.1 hypothetical protein BCPG3_139 [Bacillus phage BCPG3]
MKKTHILQDSITLVDSNGLPAISMSKGQEVAILLEFDSSEYKGDKAVVIFDGKEAMTVASCLVDEKQLELKQYQHLCPKHANDMWQNFPDQTLIMKRVFTKEECDQCKEEM